MMEMPILLSSIISLNEDFFFLLKGSDIVASAVATLSDTYLLFSLENYKVCEKGAL